MLTSHNHAPARLIVADDHDISRAGLCAVLSGDRQFEVVGQAKNASEARTLCRHFQPDVVLTEVRLPDMDGLALTRAIKQESPATSVILFTMYENADYLVEALRVGAAGYLLKGATKQEIVDTIRRVLAGESVLEAGTVMDLLRRMSMGERSEQRQPVQLTPREQDILRLIAMGRSNREIADTLTLMISTVKTQVEHLIAKLGVSDRTQAAVRAIELGLVSVPDDRSIE